MRSALGTFVVCALVLWSSGSSLVRASPTDSGPRVLVMFSPDSTTDERGAAVRAIGGVALDTIGALGVTRIAAGADYADALAPAAVIARQPGVAGAEPDGVMRLALAPNDTLYMNDPYSGLGQWGLRTARVDRAWDITRGSPSVIVAVIDTGVDADHPDLVGSLLPPAHTLTSAGGSGCALSPRDDNSHGTHLAGVIVATANNAAGIAGVAFGVKLLSIKALDCTGGGATSDVARAIVLAADSGARVINISLGSPDFSITIANAVKYAQNKGALVVAAAGNCGVGGPSCGAVNQTEFPASLAGVLAVGATSSTDVKSQFSSSGSWIGVTAPGEKIVSTTPTYETHQSRRGATLSYASFSGTSQAAPFVTGLAALILSQDPRLTASQVADRIKATADDLGDPGVDASFGAGRVNALRALSSPGGVYGAVYESAKAPASAASASPFTMSVRLTNTSNFTWPANGLVRLAYHWLDHTGKMTIWEGTRTVLPAPVPVNGSTDLTATVVAPPTAGVYTLRFDMVREGITWFSSAGVRTADATVAVSSGFAASYAPAATTPTVATGTQASLAVAVTNSGTRTWSASGAQPVRLSYHWLAADGSVAVWNGARANLPSDIAPGAAATLQLAITPPPSPGAYVLRLDLVQEGVAWFSAQGVSPRDISYLVTNGFIASYTTGSLPALLPGGRASLPVTFRNTGAATWPATGAAPIRAAAHVFDNSGAAVRWDGARTPLTANVPQGAAVSSSVVVDAPLVAGAYRARPDLVQEGVAWFSGLGSPATAVPFAVVSDYRATLPAGALTVSRASPVVTISVTNTSSAVWSANALAPVTLSSHWLDARGAALVWDGPRTKLAKDVAPGESLTATVMLASPPPGATHLVIDLVSEGVRWFGAGAARQVTVTP